MKKLLLCAVLLLSVLATVACDASILQIEDTNGAENAALATLTDADLVDTMPQVVKQGAVRSDRKGVCRFRVKKMSGVEELYTFDADPDATYRFTVTSSLTAGNLRLYVCADKRIVADIPIGEGQSVTVSGISGIASVRAAAESAAFSVEITHGAYSLVGHVKTRGIQTGGQAMPACFS